MKLPHFLRTTEGKFITFVAVLIILPLVYYFYVTGGQPSAPTTISITPEDHVRGAAGAKVTLVEFGDFQCPACGAYEPLVRQVEADNKDILQVVFKNFPLTQIHQNALLGAKAAESAGVQGKFWEMHDMLYDKQLEWSESLTARDIVEGYAKSLNLDMKKFDASMSDPAIEQKIIAEYKEGTNLGVQGTPTFFVNGKKIQNPSSPQEFDAIIQGAAKAVQQ